MQCWNECCCRAALEEFYAPHNARLYELLGQDYGW
jgi:hypothetical protein